MDCYALYSPSAIVISVQCNIYCTSQETFIPILVYPYSVKHQPSVLRTLSWSVPIYSITFSTEHSFLFWSICTLWSTSPPYSVLRTSFGFCRSIRDCCTLDIGVNYHSECPVFMCPSIFICSGRLELLDFQAIQTIQSSLHIIHEVSVVYIFSPSIYCLC